MWINRRSSCCTTLIRNSCFNRYVTERACCLSKRQASSYARVLSDVSSIGMKRMEKTVYQLHLFLEDVSFICISRFSFALRRFLANAWPRILNKSFEWIGRCATSTQKLKFHTEGRVCVRPRIICIHRPALVIRRKLYTRNLSSRLRKKMGRVCARFVLSWIGSFIYFNDEIPILSSLVSMMNNFIQRVSFLSFFFLNWRYSFRRALKWSFLFSGLLNMRYIRKFFCGWAPLANVRIAWLSRWKFSDKKKG